MKVRNLPKHDEKSLRGLKMRTSNGVIGYFFSEFNGGIFFSSLPGNDQTRERLYPQIIDSREDIMDWDVMNEKAIVNCDTLTSLRHIVNPVKGDHS